MQRMKNFFERFILTAVILVVVLIEGCGSVQSNTDVYERELSLHDDENGAGQIILNNENESEESSEVKTLYYDEEKGVGYCFKAGDEYLYAYDGENFNPVYLNGVNIGTGYPGHYPGELIISEDTYYSWFDKIAAMNCNCIRVYTMMKPDFYNALYRYNEENEEKLYLLMGLWYNEEELAETGDAFSTLNDTTSEAQKVIDAIHGNAVIDERPGAASGKYESDVSQYVLGWIIGIEMDSAIVESTNQLHPDETGYDGKYMKTAQKSSISPFDTFLCELTDNIISYEAEKYQMLRPVSWVNWPTTDPLAHPVEPYAAWEDAATINVENLQAKDSFPAGTFASYHVYPYYPEFMMLEDKYTTYRDERGRINTYEAYLKEISSFHKIPVLIAEYGLPTSRGATNVNGYMHYDQGHITEDQQAVYLADMAQSIYDSGCCGGIAFAWQDEWYKRTWNTMDYSDPGRRAFWSDVQTSEQSYGVMTFEPGEGETVVKIDGDFSDWNDATEIISGDEGTLLAKYDARYLYLCVKKYELDISKERFVLPIDITPKSGSMKYEDFTFDIPADFVIDINGKEDTRVLVQTYYDRYAYAFGAYDNMFDQVSGKKKKKRFKKSKEFVPIYLCLSRKQIIEETKEVIDAKRIETGVLQYGNADPDSHEYNSLSDFCSGQNFVEFRIPWGLLNFRDPSRRMAEDDFWAGREMSNLEVDFIKAGIATIGKESVSGEYTWDEWEQIEFYERPKKAYFALGEKYKELKLE